jgi:hypothetical protein
MVRSKRSRHWSGAKNAARITRVTKSRRPSAGGHVPYLTWDADLPLSGVA